MVQRLRRTTIGLDEKRRVIEVEVNPEDLSDSLLPASAIPDSHRHYWIINIAPQPILTSHFRPYDRRNTYPCVAYYVRHRWRIRL